MSKGNFKFLLAAVNAKYIHSNPAVYSLKAFAGKYAENVLIREYTINHLADHILYDIYQLAPDAVGFSCYIWNISMVRKLAALIRQVLPETKIWLGGPEASFESERLLSELPEADGIMIGEGEATFRDLLSHYVENAKALDEIDGLLYRETGGGLHRTGPRPAMDVSALPFIYENMEGFENRIIYYESSRGCPFSCSYCLSSLDKRLRFRNWSLVESELSRFLAEKIPQVKFVDRTFNCRAEHALKIWKYIKENDNQITNFHFEIAGDLLTKEEMEVLSDMRPGLVQLEIGVQSTNPSTLQEIRRRTDLLNLKESVKRLREGNHIHIHLDLIAGLPYEDYESFKASFNEVYAMNPHELQLGFLKVLKGSYMFEKARDYGLVYQQTPPYEVLSTKWLSFGDLIRLKRIEDMVEVYYNSGQFTNTLKYLEREFDSPFSLYESLADYYQDNGLSGIGISRRERYELLEKFAVRKAKERAEIYRELLVYDMCLREPMKARPSFAACLDSFKKEAADILSSENKEPSVLSHYRGLSYRQLCHQVGVEPFSVDVETLRRTGQLCMKKHFILFDYGRRDPVSGNVQVYKVRREDYVS